MAAEGSARNALFDTLAAKGSTFGDGEWATDDRIERAYYAWLKAGSPANVSVTAQNGPKDGNEEIVITPRRAA